MHYQFTAGNRIRTWIRLATNSTKWCWIRPLRLGSIAAMMATVVLFSQPLPADIVVFNDTFDIGSPPTRFDDAADPNDLGWWQNVSASLSVSDDSAGIGSGNSLLVTPNSSFPTFGQLGANFNTVSLNEIGDSAFLNFDFRRLTAGSLAGTNPSLRFGLYNNGGTPIGGDNNSFPNFLSNTGDDDGYLFAFGVGQGGASAFREPADGEGILAGSNNFLLGSDTVNPFGGFNTADPYEVAFHLERIADGIRLQVLVDGITYIDVEDVGIDPDTGLPAGLFITEFNTIGFGIGSTGVSYSYRLDNIRFGFSAAIPEPSAAMLVAAAIGSISLRRHRATSTC